MPTSRGAGSGVSGRIFRRLLKIRPKTRGSQGRLQPSPAETRAKRIEESRGLASREHLLDHIARHVGQAQVEQDPEVNQRWHPEQDVKEVAGDELAEHDLPIAQKKLE